MYRKGVAVELQFSPERLNDGAGDPYWIDLTHDEAQRLLESLQTRLAGNGHGEGTQAPLVVSLDETPAAPQTHGAPESPDSPAANNASPDDFKQWVCVICGWIYDEAAGLPEEGIAPGTRWADVPADWRCPLCDVGKEDFALVEF
ncbi:rubredoxin [Paraburkholderia phenoliruptrix]|uniref:Rubredoxin n=1 Tax=Paraburkholderia phenoliruptrix TaxID=252970 RepID=A0ABV3W8R1_9BURK|nr:rubredoxin [Paraburkholderia phenoliruptrix]MDR6391737.1 rubredoxin [Paraburkholderia phenoliruptrix]